MTFDKLRDKYQTVFIKSILTIVNTWFVVYIVFRGYQNYQLKYIKLTNTHNIHTTKIAGRKFMK